MCKGSVTALHPQSTLKSGEWRNSDNGVDCLQMRGTVSMRTWLIIAYLTVLHFALMASFTRRGGALTGYDLEQLCAGDRAHSLPGT